jgi:hypothetical protein
VRYSITAKAFASNLNLPAHI